MTRSRQPSDAVRRQSGAERPARPEAPGSVPLQAVLCTDSLHRRPSRAPDYETENRALVALAQALADTPRNVLQTLADTLLDVFKCGSAGVSLLSKDEKSFVWAAIAGLWQPYIGAGTPRNFGPCGDVLDCNAALLFNHLERRYPYLLPVTPLAAEWLLVPFQTGAKTVGTVWVIAHDEHRTFDAEDLRQLGSLSRFASVAYQTQAALDAALKTEERYRTVFESTGDGFCILEKVQGEASQPLDFRYVEANAWFELQAGMRGVVGRTLRQVNAGELEDWLRRCDAVLETGESVRFERGLVEEGQVLEVRAFRVEYPTRHCVGLSFKDITERKRAEELLRCNHDTFLLLIENAPFGVYVVDSQFRMCQASAVSLNVFSSVRPLIGRDFEDIVRAVWTEPVASEVLLRFRHTLATGQAYAAPNTTGLRKDVPGLESYDWKIQRLQLPSGQFGVVCHFYDVTERKLVEDALRERDAFTRSIIDSSPDCIKVLDLEGNLLSMESGQELLGIEDIQPFLNTSWIEFWGPEHRQAAREAVASAAAGKTARFVGFFRTFRGEPKWWDVAVSAIPGAQGKPTRLLSVSRDVTQRKQAELNLEFLSSLSRDLVQWTSVDALMQIIGAKLAAQLQLSLCAFVEIDETAEQAVVHHDWHRQDVPSLVGVHRLEEFVGDEFLKLARAGDVIVVRDAVTDPRIDSQNFAALKIASFLCVPLLQGGHWRFALCLYKSEAYDWRQDEIEMARDLTARIWTRLERLRTEASLSFSERRYRNLFESIEEGFCVIDKVAGEAGEPLDFLCVEANRAFETHSGLREPVGKTMRQLVPQAAEEWFLPYDAVLRTGESIRFERELVANGRVHVLELYAFRVEAQTRASVAVIFKDVTKRRQSEQALRQSEERFRALVLASSDVVYRMSPDWSEMRQLLGKNFVVDAAVPSTNWLQEYIDPADQPQVMAVIQEAIRTKSLFELEHQVRLVDGSLGWTYSHAIPLLDAAGEIVEWFGTASDVTEHKRAEQALRESEDRYRNLFNSMDEGYCIIEVIFDGHSKPVDYIFLEVNPSFETMGGLHNAQGKRILELLPDIEEYWLETYGKVALTGEAVRVVNEVKPLNRWFDVYAFRFGGAESRKVALLFTNITDRKRIETEFIAALQAAESANLAKSNFLSSMSHELRSPLNSVLGFAQLIQSGTPPPTPLQQESVDHILKAGWYLLELIDEILDLAQIESGHLSLTPEPVSLAEVLRDCYSMVDLQARALGIQLSFPTLASDCLVRADRTRVRQVFINLLSNAIKYNRPGGTVRVSCAARPLGRLRISFEDSGKGIAVDQLGRLFQPFERLGQEAGLIEGTGIGLVVSKRLVELMGGQIGAQSTVGLGSVFWVDLVATLAWPLALDEAGAPGAPGAPGALDGSGLREAPSPPATRLFTVLCIEDDPANQLLMRRMLARRTDLHLLLAANGSQGVELARASRPDVVLMDINMPGMSGLEAMKLLADDAATAHIPVIAVSANAMPRDVEKGVQAGFFRYLTKPLKIDRFMEALDAALDSPKAGSR